MDIEIRELGSTFARHIVGGDLRAAHALLADEAAPVEVWMAIVVRGRPPIGYLEKTDAD